ncbi:MAG TPA: hypothetical protein VHK63_06825, partial [Candidatus Limnocylindria bacterium]|nr:hypothetical protein [Candidatus Limnocylindria bacterium]
MTGPSPIVARRRWAAGCIAALAGATLLLAACGTAPTVTPSIAPSIGVSPTVDETPTADPTAQPTARHSVQPTARPEPPLSLALPTETDPRRVRVAVSNEVPSDGNGRLVVTVTNLSDRRVGELVLRWPTQLRESLFLAPFQPSPERIAEPGPPLWQEWTKWVEGPGERGEPAGTTSLGWGPLDPGATLVIPLVVTRQAAGEV